MTSNSHLRTGRDRSKPVRQVAAVRHRYSTGLRRVDGKRRANLAFEQLERRNVLSHAVADHIHVYLEIFVNDQEVTIPADIGVTASDGRFSPHTNDATGELHIGDGLPAGIDRAERYVILKDFFDVWRTTNVGDLTKNNPNATFDSTHLLGNVADATHGVFMLVNGAPSTEFENYVPHDGDRIVLSYGPIAGGPVLAPIANLTLLSGSPQYVSLATFDPNGQDIAYSVTTNSNPSLVQTSVPTGNPFVRMQVASFGSMVFELLRDKVRRPVDRVTTLANQGFYDGLTFHRVINRFVIQGGDPAGNGTGGSTLGPFDDEFHVDLQHNRTGLLSFAKSTDDTNNSQVFITEGPQRHLDFNHSVFGVLVKGEDVRDAISNVPVGANDKPVTPVVIESMDVIEDNADGVLLLKAVPGASGTATITVTATDTDGNSTNRTFVVNVAPDSFNGGPFLNDISPPRTTMNTPLVLTVTSQDVEGNAVTYNAAKADSNASSVSVNSISGVVTVTPPNGFVGRLLVEASVRAAVGQPNDTSDKQDRQVFSVDVAPLAPTSVDLVAGADSGTSSTDDITNVMAPQITINGVTIGAIAKLYQGATLLGQAIANDTSVTIIASTLAQGTNLLSATQTVNLIESDPSELLAVTVDTTAPSFTSNAPSAAFVNVAFPYDVATNEEQSAGHSFSLADGAPVGVTINDVSGAVSWIPSLPQVGVQSFQIVATDAAGNVAKQDVSVDVLELDPTAPWRNPLNRLDVDADTFVVSLDALLVINDLNKNGPRSLPDPSAPMFLLDVTGDNFVAPDDALLVINYLNTQPSGESPASWERLSEGASVDGASAVHDEVATYLATYRHKSNDDVAAPPAMVTPAWRMASLVTIADALVVTNLCSPMPSLRVVPPPNTKEQSPLEAVLVEIADDVSEAWHPAGDDE